MTIILDPARPVPFRPRGDDADGPTYLLRVPKVMDRSIYLEAVKAAKAVLWSNPQLVGFAKDSLKSILKDESQAEALAGGLAEMDLYLDRLTAARAAREADKNEETEREFDEAWPLPDDLVELLESISEHDPKLAKKFAQSSIYWHRAGIVAARMFMVGWDRPERFKVGINGASEEMLAMIPDNDFVGLALKIREMLEPTEARMGNSASPSSGHSKGNGSLPVGKTTRPKTPSPVQPETATA